MGVSRPAFRAVVLARFVWLMLVDLAITLREGCIAQLRCAWLRSAHPSHSVAGINGQHAVAAR